MKKSPFPHLSLKNFKFLHSIMYKHVYLSTAFYYPQSRLLDSFLQKEPTYQFVSFSLGPGPAGLGRLKGVMESAGRR